MTIVITSDSEPPERGTEFLGHLLSELEIELIPFIGTNREIKKEVFLTIFYYGIRIHYSAMNWEDFDRTAGHIRELVEQKLGPQHAS
jgi:hypothetical protein